MTHSISPNPSNLRGVPPVVLDVNFFRTLEESLQEKREAIKELFFSHEWKKLSRPTQDVHLSFWAAF